MSRVKVAKSRKGRLSTKVNAVPVGHAAEKTAVSVKSGEVTQEIAGYSSDFLAAALVNGVVPNPDDIMMMLAPRKLSQYQGLATDPYKLHRMMRRSDLKYKSLMQTRKNGVLSKEWQVLPNPTDPDVERATEVADFVRAALDGLSNFHADLGELLEAIPCGYAVSEIMWVQRAVRYGDGMEREAWVPGELRQRRQGRFGFASDWSLRYQETGGKFVEVPDHKFIVHTHSQENESKYGTPECAEVFWAWYMKHHFVKWWAIFGEKFGMPTAIGKHPANWDDEKRRKLLQVLKSFQTEYGLVIPKDADIEFIEAQRSGAINTYEKFCEWCDKCLSEAITGQSLATGQGQNGRGSYAQSQTHEQVKQEYVESDAKELMASVNGQLIVPMAAFNFGPDVPAPRWVVDYESRNLSGDLDLDKALVNDIRLPLTTKYFYDKYGRPEPAEGEDVVRGRAAAKMPGDDLTQRREDAESAEEKPEKKVEEIADDDDEANAKRKDAKSAKKEKKKHGKMLFAVSWEAEGEVERRRLEVDRISDSLVAEGRGIFAALGDEIEEAAKGSTDLRELKEWVQEIAATGETRADLARSLMKAKVNGYLVAAAQSAAYVDGVLLEEETQTDTDQKGIFAKFLGWARAGQGKFEKSALELLADYEPLEPSKALEWFENLVPMTKGELEDLPREAAGHAFTISDIETRSALQEVQDLIGKYLGNGGTLEEFRGEYQDKRRELGLDAAENHRVEALFRTEIMRAYGAGRTRSLNDPVIKGAFPLWQYVAVLDDRTRDEHAALDGFVAAPDDVVWLSKTPPWDYNCRCDVIPLSRRQIETRGIVEEPTVTMPDGSEVDPRGWPTSPGFRGVGF